MLDIQDLHVRYPIGRGFGRHRAQVDALSGVGLSVQAGSALGVVGESGCGKSTLARAVTGLVPISSGRVLLDGAVLDARRDRAAARRIQLVFQDPTASLNPRLRVGSVLCELMKAHRLHEGAAAQRRSAELMELVGLPANALTKRPHEFSGGQRQRIGIARALCVEPDVLIADEAVSALDVSTRAVVVTLLDRLRRELDIAMVFIAHDLGIVRTVCDHVAVMHRGRIVEQGPTESMYLTPLHPYTRALLAAVPRIGAVRPPGSARPYTEPGRTLHPPSD